MYLTSGEYLGLGEVGVMQHRSLKHRLVINKKLDKSRLPKVEVDDLVNNLISVMPSSVQELFLKQKLYFELSEDGTLGVGADGVERSIQEKVVEKLDAYLGEQPHYFVGLELSTEQ